MLEERSPMTGARNIFERLLRYAAVLGGLILLTIMFLVSTAVYFRYINNNPILGDSELVEIGMSLVVMLAMPYTTLRKQHIRVDILDHYIGSVGRFIGDFFARGIGIFVLYLLIGKTFEKTLDAHKYGDVTNMIEIPVSLAYGAITCGFALCILVLAGQLVSQIRQGILNYE